MSRFLRLSARLGALALLLAACSGNGGPRRAAPAGRPTTVASPSTTSPLTVAAAARAAGFEQQLEPALPVALQEGAAASTGDRLYVAGGYDTSENSRADVFVFDGAAWTRGPSLPIRVNHPGAAAIGADVYVAGGFTPAGATNRVFVLHAGAPQWRELAPMRRPRGALALLAVAGRLYAIGGRAGPTQISAPEVYDPRAGAWTDAAPVPAPRNHVAGYTEGPFACVAGGRTPATSAAVDCLDTTTGAWQARSPLPVATSGAAAVDSGGVTLVAGGEPSTETTLVGVVQELRAGRWSSRPMLVPRHGTANALYRGRLWLCGGATAPGFHAVATCTSFG